MASEQVDVLAVMQQFIDCYTAVEECPDDTAFLAAAAEARDAVSELIAAVRPLAGAIASAVAPDWPAKYPCEVELDAAQWQAIAAALARIAKDTP